MNKKLKQPFVSVAWLRAMAQHRAWQRQCDRLRRFTPIDYVFPPCQPLQRHELN